MARGGDTLYITWRRDLDRVRRFAGDHRSRSSVYGNGALEMELENDSGNSASGSPVLVGNLLVADD